MNTSLIVGADPLPPSLSTKITPHYLLPLNSHLPGAPQSVTQPQTNPLPNSGGWVSQNQSPSVECRASQVRTATQSWTLELLLYYLVSPPLLLLLPGLVVRRERALQSTSEENKCGEGTMTMIFLCKAQGFPRLIWSSQNCWHISWYYI